MLRFEPNSFSSNKLCFFYIGPEGNCISFFINGRTVFSNHCVLPKLIYVWKIYAVKKNLPSLFYKMENKFK